MDLTSDLLPRWLLWLGAIIFGLLLYGAVRRAPWARLTKDNPSQLHVWLGAVVVLFVLWNIAAGTRPGLNLHLLGATAMTLMFGPELAFLALTLAMLAAIVTGHGNIASLPVNAVLSGALPVTLAFAIYRLVDARLPNHFFVYVFVNAFAAAGLVTATTGFLIASLLSALGTYPSSYLFSEYFPYFVLLSWSEALLTGMTITLMVVYRPAWVETFDDTRYLQGK